MIIERHCVLTFGSRLHRQNIQHTAPNGCEHASTQYGTSTITRYASVHRGMHARIHATHRMQLTKSFQMTCRCRQGMQNSTSTVKIASCAARGGRCQRAQESFRAGGILKVQDGEGMGHLGEGFKAQHPHAIARWVAPALEGVLRGVSVCRR